MARNRTENIAEASISSGFKPLPKGEYNVVITEIKSDDPFELTSSANYDNPRAGVEINKLQVVLGVVGGEYEGRIIWARFNLNPIDKVKADAIKASLSESVKVKYDKAATTDELKMEKFMFALGLDERCETDLPTETSWLSSKTIDWLKINAANKGLRVEVYITKSKKKQDGSMSEPGNGIGDYMKFNEALPNGTVSAKSTGTSGAASVPAKEVDML